MPALPRHRRLVILAAALCAIGGVCAPAFASESPAEGEGADKPQAADPRSVSIPVVIAPVVDGGKLVGYIYLGLKLMAEREGAADRMRDELPLLQDRILRAFNNAPISAADAGTDAAKAALVKTATSALASLAEAQGVTAVTLTDMQNVPF
jgi:flagellar basal body-associated protein FliL